MKWKESQKDMSRQKVGSQLSAMNAATAQMVTLTSAGPDDTDYTAVGSAVQTMWVENYSIVWFAKIPMMQVLSCHYDASSGSYV